MVSGVLHNACLRMDEEGAGLDDLLSPSGIHRWLGRGGIAIGGAASLLVGAVFGGVLESIPVLLPPPAAAVSSPHIDSGGGAGLPANTPWSLAANAVPAVQATPQPAPAIGAPAGSNFSSVPAPTLAPVGSKSTSGAGGSVTQPGTGNSGGGVLSGGGGGGSTPSVPSGPSTPPPPTSPIQPVLNVVQSTANTATGVVQNTVGTVTGATQTVVSGTSSGTGSTSSTGTLSGTTGTVTNTLNNTTSSLGL